MAFASAEPRAAQGTRELDSTCATLPVPPTLRRVSYLPILSRPASRHCPLRGTKPCWIPLDRPTPPRTPPIEHSEWHVPSCLHSATARSHLPSPEAKKGTYPLALLPKLWAVPGQLGRLPKVWQKVRSTYQRTYQPQSLIPYSMMSRSLEIMTPRPKVASGPLVAQPALPLTGPISTTHRATSTATIKAGEFIVFCCLNLRIFHFVFFLVSFL